MTIDEKVLAIRQSQAFHDKAKSLVMIEVTDGGAHEPYFDIDKFVEILQRNGDTFANWLNAFTRMAMLAGAKLSLEYDEKSRYNVVNIRKHGFEFGIGIGKD